MTSARTRKFSSTINRGFFFYPTGEPVLESASQLREDLRTTQRLFDPKGAALLRTMSLSSLRAWEDYLRTLWYQTQARISGMCLRPSR